MSEEQPVIVGKGGGKLSDLSLSKKFKILLPILLVITLALVGVGIYISSRQHTKKVVEETINNNNQVSNSILEQGKVEDATKYLQEQAENSNNKSVQYEAYLKIARENAYIFEYDKAIENYLKAVDLNPNNHAAVLELAGIYYIKGDREKAKEYYSKGLTLMRNNQASAEEVKQIEEIIMTLNK